MAYSRFPQDKKWRGQFSGKYAGNIWQSFNIDLERQPGRLVLADKLIRFVSGLGVVTKFIRTNASATDEWFGIVHDTDILRNGASTITAGTWITDDTTGTFNDPRDVITHEFANGEQRLLCSRATNMAILNKAGGANVWDDDWWTTVASGPALASLDYHPLARLQRLVAVGDKQTGVPVIHTLDRNDVVSSSRLTLPPDYTVRLAMVSSNRFWFGLEHDYDGNARIIEWDGFSLTYNHEYDLVGRSPLTGFVVNDVPYYITEKGGIFKFRGGSFKEVQNFNIHEDRVVFSPTISANNTIIPHGAYVDEEVVYINVGAPTVITSSATVLNTASRRQRSGVWVFNTENLNLTHHMGLGEHAVAGTDVNYGTSPLQRPGTILKATIADEREIIASGAVYVGGTTWRTSGQSGIYRQIPNSRQGSNAGRNRGYFITPYLPVEEAEAMWEALIVKFKRFVNSNNRIVIKWRVTEPLFNSSAQDQGANDLDVISAPATWASTTTLTCKVPTGVAAGDEIEILVGDNAGCSFNISTLSGTPDNSTSLTITLSEAAPVSSTDTCLVRFDNFKTETAISSTSVGNSKVPFTSVAHGEFVQLKIELRGFDVQIDEIMSIFKVKSSAWQA